MVIAILGILVALLLPAVQAAREAISGCSALTQRSAELLSTRAGVLHGPTEHRNTLELSRKS